MDNSIGTIDSIYKNNSNETVILEHNPNPRMSDIENNIDTIHKSLLREGNKSCCNGIWIYARIIIILVSFVVAIVLLVLGLVSII